MMSLRHTTCGVHIQRRGHVLRHAVRVMCRVNALLCHTKTAAATHRCVEHNENKQQHENSCGKHDIPTSLVYLNPRERTLCRPGSEKYTNCARRPHGCRVLSHRRGPKMFQRLFVSSQ